MLSMKNEDDRRLSYDFLTKSGVWRQYDGKLIDWSKWWRVLPNDPNGGDPKTKAIGSSNVMCVQRSFFI